jgi:hypothetical protein
MVTIQSPDGTTRDITEKKEMQQAIMQSNLSKFQQSHHNPFYHFPLSQELGFKGTTATASTVLAGEYELSHDILESAKNILAHLKQPDQIHQLGPINMYLSLHEYRKLWKKSERNNCGLPRCSLLCHYEGRGNQQNDFPY